MAQAFRQFSTACRRSTCEGRTRRASFGGDLEIRDQEDEVQLRRDREHLPLPVAHNVESAVGRRGGIIRMTFQFRADFENLPALERPVQPARSSHEPLRAAPSRCLPRPRAWRDVAGDRAGKWKGLALAALEECVGRGANHRVDRPAAAAKSSRHYRCGARRPRQSKPGSEIGCARRNSDGDLLHDWQRCAG